MANELTVTATLTYTPSAANQVKISPPAFSKTITMTGDDHAQGTQQIGISTAEALAKNDIGTTGWLLVKNCDANNYIELGISGFTTGTGSVKLKAGEFALYRTSSAPFALANTASVTVQYWLFED